ncbi:MAG: AMP-binding protein [Desulfobacteraceae bacterium]
MESPHGLTVYDIFSRNSRHYGTLPAVAFNDLTLTHADLFSESRKLAMGLKTSGLKPGDRIAVLNSNHPAFFHLFAAAAALNITLVLINRRLSYEEIRFIIEDTRPAMLIADREHAGFAEKLNRECDCLDDFYIVDSSGKAPDFSNLYHTERLDRPLRIKSSDPYLVIHTAAVQGKPRGAVLSHENVVLINEQIKSVFRLDCSSVYLNVLPLFHIMGINLALATLQAGGANIIQEKFEPAGALDLIQKHRAGLIGSFPPILSNIIEAQEEKARDLSTLKYVVGLESPEVVKKLENLTGAKFWSIYGQTETSGLITFAEYNEKNGSAGRPCPLADLRVVDEFDQVLPPDLQGEIVLRGPLVFRGYLNADALNQHTFREGWHHTGDLGVIDSEGHLFFKGRKAEKELIKSGGENVFPVEVEKVIASHDAVKEVCVIGIPDPKFGEGIKAICSLHEGKTLTEKELMDFTATQIASYKKPRYVQFMDELPKTQTGAVDREKLKQDI